MLPLQSNTLTAAAPASKQPGSAVAQTEGHTSQAGDDTFESILRDAAGKEPAKEPAKGPGHSNEAETPGDPKAEKTSNLVHSEDSDTDGIAAEATAPLVIEKARSHAISTDTPRAAHADPNADSGKANITPPSDAKTTNMPETETARGPELSDARNTVPEARMQTGMDHGQSTSGKSSVMIPGLAQDQTGVSKVTLPVAASAEMVDVKATKQPSESSKAIVVQSPETRDAEGTMKLGIQVTAKDADVAERPVRDDVEIRIRNATVPVQTQAPAHPLQSILHAQLPDHFRGPVTGTAGTDGQDIGILREMTSGPDIPAEFRKALLNTTSTANRPDGQVTVSRQMTDAVRMAPSADKVIEVALSPAELGRVRMTMTPSEAGIAISITAERSDTLELLRRNIHDLQQSFAELGYADISFAFGQEQAGSQGGLQNSDTREEGEAYAMPLPVSPDAVPMRPLAHSSTGIDIRV